MIEKDFYNTIDKPGIAEFKDRGSKFVAYAFPIVTVNNFKKRLEEVKREHPKATHHCFAYRLGTDKNNFRVSDDGEPSGTAGKQILGQIDSRNLTYIFIVVVRYFGGSLLGVPGLINAYKTSASLVIQVTPIVQKAIEIIYTLEFDYTMMNSMMIIIKQLNCSIINQETQLFCRFSIGVPVKREQEFLYRVGELKNIQLGKHKPV
ncbi:MAG: YigZ family protein [Chitinophagaceae bacterium]|nr:YigZ family protein [Chitinophagaceae bacterium]